MTHLANLYLVFKIIHLIFHVEPCYKDAENNEVATCIHIGMICVSLNGAIAGFGLTSVSTRSNLSLNLSFFTVLYHTELGKKVLISIHYHIDSEALE